MRGEVLHYDEDQGFGFITGADGNRYTFAREDLRREAAIGRGTVIEFQPAGGRARDVISIRAQTASPPAATAAPTQAGNAPGAPQHFGRSAESRPASATGLWDYFRRGLTENYFNFSGRARRKEYWGYCLFWTIALIVVIGVGLFIDDAMGHLDDLPAVTVGLCGAFVPGDNPALDRTERASPARHRPDRLAFSGGAHPDHRLADHPGLRADPNAGP